MKKRGRSFMVGAYLFSTLGAPIFMLLGGIAFLACLGYLVTHWGLGMNPVVMFYLNGAISVFCVGCALIVYRGTVLTDIAQEIERSGASGAATVLSVAYNGYVEAEKNKQWYELKLAVQPDEASLQPFNVDIEQLFSVTAEPMLKEGNVLPVKFFPDNRTFALVVADNAFARLK